MSRPDAVYWRNTNQLNSLEFSPGRLVYNRVPRWVLSLMILQVVLGALIGCAVLLTPAREWSRTLTRSAFANAHAPATTAQPVAQPAGGLARLASLISLEDAAVALSLAASQLAAAVLIQLIALPLVRRALRRHAGGLKDVFEAIRAMAAGVAPKPLTAGRPGESGFLALAFNDMMARIAAQRKELVEANETLEKKVEIRTQELREAAEKLEKMAQIDALTGLANRRALMDQGERRVSSAVHGAGDLVCFMIDLDNFKNVNDTLGHAMGDEVIRIAADTLRGCCRPDDLPARLGGDEFTVLMGAEAAPRVVVIAQRLQDDFRTRIDAALKDAPAKSRPSMSIGVASLRSADVASLADLMSRADTALYQAKHGGKARAQVYRKDAA
jgi:diguanylate cyclase (GGDEF)-like protein